MSTANLHVSRILLGSDRSVPGNQRLAS